MSKRARITLNPAPDNDAGQEPEGTARPARESGTRDDPADTLVHTPETVAAPAWHLGRVVKLALVGLALVAAVIILKRRPGG